MRQTKAKLIFFCLTKARAHVLERREKSKERKRRKERKKKEKEKKAKPRYVFVLNSWVFWILKAPFSSRKFSTLSKIQNMKIFNVF